MTRLITEALVRLDANLGTSTTEVINHLSAAVVDAGRAGDADALAADGIARESKTATGVPGGIAIPHCRSAAVTEPTLAMARLAPPVDFGAKDGPADLVFFIAAPEGADKEHLGLLSKLARSLVKKDFTAALRAAATPAAIVELVEQAVSPAPAPAPAGTTPAQAPSAAPAPHAAGTTPAPATADRAAVSAGAGSSTAGSAPVAVPAGSAASSASDTATLGRAADSGRRPSLVAVTACPTGIAHTYMAADSLVAAAQEAGVDLQVETQGSAGATPLDPAAIAAADAVIFAVDVDVRDKDRFAGMPVIQVPVKRGIDEPDKLVADALAAARDPQARRVQASGAGAPADSVEPGQRESVGGQLKRVLLTGVSYMIPFVAGGGLLIALGFLMGGYNITDFADQITVGNALWNLPTEFPDTAWGPLGAYLGAVAFKIGSLSMGFLVPALAGYIAYALADRPGIAPGFVAGAVAGVMGAGFLGGIVGGLIAGYAAKWLGGLTVNRVVRSLMPVVIIPLVASIVASGLLFLLLGAPIASFMVLLTGWLNGMTGAAAALLGLILGVMMGFDLGGPVNKVAYSFAVAGLGAGAAANQAPWQVMAAVMAAGMVPPLAMALATTLDKKRFSAVEHENGKAAWLLGAAFISEGAIPFAAADPLRVIPASMLGAGVTGAIAMASGVTSQAPHGGVFVFFAIGNFLMFLVAVAAGTVVAALAVLALKRFATRKVAA